MSVLSVFSYRFRAVLKEILAGIFVEIEKVILKYIWKFKGPRIANIIIKEKQKERSWKTYIITLQDLL